MLENLSLKLFFNTELIYIAILCIISFLIICLIFTMIPNNSEPEKIIKDKIYRQSKPKLFYTKKDYFFIITITVMYAIVSLYQLGSTTMPSTYWQPTHKEQEIILELDNPEFTDIYVIGQEGDNNNTLDGYQIGYHNANIYGSNDNHNYYLIDTLDDYHYLRWDIISGEYNYRYIKIETSSLKTTLTEIGFYNKHTESFNNVSVYKDVDDALYSAYLLIDEQNEIPLTQTYMTNTYFDEIYHPRNAVEIVNQQYMYASVHPLLGTSIMALGIKLLGINTLGFRIMGALFGIIMLPLVYALGKRLFNRTYFATLVCTLFACDFMHITTSRIATLEPFSVFFIIAMYYFMVKYFYSSFYDTPLKKQFTNLALSAIFMAFAISTKWTGCYGAVGLAILFFTNIFNRYQEYCKAKDYLVEIPDLDNDIEEFKEKHEDAKMIVETFKPKLIKTIAWCFLWFVFITIIIYCLSYVITPVWRDGYSLKNVIDQNIYMYEYHIDLEASHPFESVWWQWILDIRPIWYYTGYEGNIYHSISCFSNPLINLVSIISLPYTLYHAFIKHNRNAWIIIIGFISNLAPWLLVTRCVFSYHYYPSVIFMILSIVFMFKEILQKHPRKVKYINIYILLVIIVFIIFLPLTCGFGTTYEFSQFMELLPTWNF